MEYAPLAESLGRVLWASEVFNCPAPDTGNMEVLAPYGTSEPQAQWLQPLPEGRIRSAFSMTVAEVASSDATHFHCRIRRESSGSADSYAIDWRKWYTPGALNEDCRRLIVMGLTDPDHAAQDCLRQVCPASRHLVIDDVGALPEQLSKNHRKLTRRDLR